MESCSVKHEKSNRDALIREILTAVAEHEECEPLELPPLYQAIDPDALRRVAKGPAIATVTFSYYGYQVTIQGEGDRSIVTEKK